MTSNVAEELSQVPPVGLQGVVCQPALRTEMLEERLQAGTQRFFLRSGKHAGAGQLRPSLAEKTPFDCFSRE
jgi:hypothetical protein